MGIMGRPWILDYDSANCAIGATVAIIGERSTFLVLREAFNGVRRFDDMRRRTGMPRQVLSDRLTSKGLDLYPVLVGLLEWGNQHAVGPAGPQVELRHRDCGEPVRLQLACAAGHVLADAREVTPVPGPGARKIA